MSTTHTRMPQIPATVLDWPRTPSYAHYISTMMDGRGFPPKQQPTSLDQQAILALAAVPEFVHLARTTLLDMTARDQSRRIGERTLRTLARRGSGPHAIGMAAYIPIADRPNRRSSSTSASCPGAPTGRESARSGP